MAKKQYTWTVVANPGMGDTTIVLPRGKHPVCIAVEDLPGTQASNGSGRSYVAMDFVKTFWPWKANMTVIYWELNVTKLVTLITE